MGILINGLNMPKNDERLCIDIHPDGKVSYNLDLKCKQIATAASVPPHGRLIDADALIATENQHYALIEDDWYVTVRKVELMPTIIPAEEA